jgi:competence ComEA-like helix-hairpin-helix protein
VDWRAEHGPFASPEELTQVPGIGEGLLEQIRDNITAEG